jgi:diguanylate cyclase (GGDEF)-like protein
MTDSEPEKDSDQTIVHEAVVERVLDDASMVVEVRIAQFRAALAILLIIFTLQFEWQSGVKSSFTTVGVAISLFALAFSVYVILTNRKTPPTSVVALAIFSIGLDATLMVLPVSIYFTTPEVPTILPMHSGALLNQPTVFAMYLLVIASGLRFRQVAFLGIAVNSLVILCLMLMEALSSRLFDATNPMSMLAIKQHILLLICSALLAWLISTHTRATTQKAAQAALMATTDALTGAYNRHHLRERLDELCARPDRSIHLLMVDADHFKSINDTMGHLIGDRVLIEVARRLQAALRPTDMLARYGGEEFCVVLPDIDDIVALAIAERLRKAIAATEMEGRKVTVSVGLSRRTPDDTIAALLGRADQALYRAKEGGRNQVQAEWPDGFDGSEVSKREDENV